MVPLGDLCALAVRGHIYLELSLKYFVPTFSNPLNDITILGLVSISEV